MTPKLASWEEYAAVRKIIIIYLQVVGLWDFVIDFAAATRGVPWARENGTDDNPNVTYKTDETGAQRAAGNHLRCYTKLADLTTVFFALVVGAL